MYTLEGTISPNTSAMLLNKDGDAIGLLSRYVLTKGVDGYIEDDEWKKIRDLVNQASTMEAKLKQIKHDLEVHNAEASTWGLMDESIIKEIDEALGDLK